MGTNCICMIRVSQDKLLLHKPRILLEIILIKKHFNCCFKYVHIKTWLSIFLAFLYKCFNPAPDVIWFLKCSLSWLKNFVQKLSPWRSLMALDLCFIKFNLNFLLCFLSLYNLILLWNWFLIGSYKFSVRKLKDNKRSTTKFTQIFNDI